LSPGLASIRAIPVQILPQPGAAPLADVPVDIAAQVFPARRASPVEGGKIEKDNDDQHLQDHEGVLREIAEKIGTLVERGKQKNNEERRRDGNDLAGLAHGEIPPDFLVVLFLHPGNFLVQKNLPGLPARSKNRLDYRSGAAPESRRI
jgi:hypothetical protein